MDSDYIQHVRYKLQKRLKRLNTADVNLFHNLLVQTWDFLQGEPVMKGILEDLERRAPPETLVLADGILKGTPHVGKTESSQDAISFWVVKKCVASISIKEEWSVGFAFKRGGDVNEGLETFREIFVERLFDYIDEQLDDKRMTLALLTKYKHRCEWFRRDALRNACQADSKRGEQTLAYDLYEYLHDQGVRFHIEPQSESGRVDLISSQPGKDRLLADTKIFDPDRSLDRGYIVKGFRQLYDYLKDYNEPFGYLVIFKTCEAELAISTPARETGTPFIVHNGKTIFTLCIDICAYPMSASKRGKLKSHEITSQEFIEAIPTGTPAGTTPV